MTDYVSIRDLSVDAVIGVHPWEREIEQTLVFNVDMAADVRRAAISDDLADALDYSAVAEVIAAVVRDGKFRLIETAADHVADRLLASFPISRLRLELRKPIADGGYTAVITIERPLPVTAEAVIRGMGNSPSRSWLRPLGSESDVTSESECDVPFHDREGFCPQTGDKILRDHDHA